MTIAGTRRLYAVSAGPWPDIEAWLSRYRRFWTGWLDALDTEIARGRRTPRSPARPTTTTPGTTTPARRQHPRPRRPHEHPAPPQDSGYTRLRLDHVVLAGEQATGYGAGWEDFLVRLEAALTGDDPQFASVETLLAPRWAAALADARPRAATCRDASW